MSEYSAIPDELKERDQWLLWDASADTPRRPHWGGDFYGISWNDPDDWHTFEQAVSMAATTESWGIGYVMAMNNDEYARGLYGCLDLDGCATEDGDKKDWIPGLGSFFDESGYVEWSPSGTGIHIPLVGQEVPEWWSDSHFSDEEHEGVEFLAHKFVTFTGNKLRGAGDVVSDADPEPFLREAYEIINGHPPDQETTIDTPTSVQTGDSDNQYDTNDDDLTVEEMENALDHISANCGYTEWRGVLYGIHDWDNGSTGRRLAEQWSRGPGWDDDASKHLDNIWTDAEQDKGGKSRTVGTVIHKAHQNGWSSSSGGSEKAPLDVVADDSDASTDPSTTDGGVDTGESPPDAIPATPDSPGGGPGMPNPSQDDTPASTDAQFKSQVRDAIAAFEKDDGIKRETARNRIAIAFLDHYDFVFPEEEVQGWRTTLYSYHPPTGVYEPRGKRFVQKRLEAAAGDFVTNQATNEIVGKIKRKAIERGDNFMAPPQQLVVTNGILDLHTGELTPHTPDEYHRTYVDVRWNPDAGEPDAVDDFLHEIVADDDVVTLYRLIAHTLYKEYIGEKAAILIGSGKNGKSLFIKFIQQFIGRPNAAHRELQDFDNDDFAANNLKGKLANLATEIGEQELKNTTTFKKLTGRDTMDAQVKYESPVTFENYATMMFSTNNMPVFGQDNYAIWRRWVYLDFPYSFDANDPTAKDPEPKSDILDRLTTNDQLEALLVRCQAEIQRWHNDSEEPFFADAMSPSAVGTR
jgi:Uncharacterized conserved protein